ncbi:MAG: ABC transporter ATP-binding protein, partial [Dactylosporangium sp.]|nr:ABC transporter ATP-binding protein [Dactylosporangium sp.]
MLPLRQTAPGGRDPLALRESFPADPDEYAIVAQDVTRWFGQVPALRRLSITVPYGRVTGLVGPNGAGKTTLLLILATLLAPDEGVVRVAGFDPVTQPARVRASLGWMPDTLGVYDQLTAREYLCFFARTHRMDRRVASARAAELLATLHLEAFADSPVHVLSRGQKQRLALARALVHRPSILLLDEPASGLDPRARIELRDLLRDLAASGTAVLVSSHILTELEAIADEVVFVAQGQTVDERHVAALGTRHRPTWRVRAIDPA